MFLRKKGKYWQMVESVNGKQKVIEHIGIEKRLLQLVRQGKELEKIGTEETEFEHN